MRLFASTITLSGVPLGRENPLPQFCAPVQDRRLTHDGTFSAEDEYLFGYQTGKRILPYAAQDRYTRNWSPQTIKTVVLENENLKAVFLPEYGARLYSLYDKRRCRELLYRNESLRFGNLAQRNAWFSGGIEFNFGHYGHSALTCAPMFAAEVQGPGYSVLRFYEYERVTSGFYQMDFHLPDGAETLDMFVRLRTFEEQDVPTYWWTNAAVRQTLRCRVFSGTGRILFSLPRPSGAPDTTPCFAAGNMPEIRLFDGDCSYPAQIDFSCEYFFQNEQNSVPWEAIGYEDGRLFFEVSTQPLRYKKMFCWGEHPGGRRWQSFLNMPEDARYLELQSGIAPTQLHGARLSPGHAIEFTQCFGSCELPDGCLEAEWHQAAGTVGKTVKERLPDLNERHERFRAMADFEIRELYSLGSGWGALECARLSQNGVKPPPGTPFPSASIGAAQLPWLALLRDGVLPLRDSHAAWNTGGTWQKLLEDSAELPGGRHWDSLLQLGVMRMENSDACGAREAFEESLGMRDSPVTWRNLSQYYLRGGELKRAASCMEEAVSTTEALDTAYSEEYLSLLISDGQYRKAWDYYHALDPEHRSDRCEIILCQAALELREDGYLEDFFGREHPVIQEGEHVLTDVWYIWQARLRGQDEAHVRRTVPMPADIDFRMFVAD